MDDNQVMKAIQQAIETIGPYVILKLNHTHGSTSRKPGDRCKDDPLLFNFLEESHKTSLNRCVTIVQPALHGLARQ